MPDRAGVHRVLMTGDTVGGVWTFTMELAEALQAQGVEVVLATLGGHPGEAQRKEAAAVPNLRLVTSAYKLEWMDDPWQDVEESGRWLLDLEQRIAPDVVHLNSYGHGGLAWRAPTVLTAHSCVLSWWDCVKGGRLPGTWDRYRQVVSGSLAAARRVAAPSRVMLESVARNYGPDLPPTHVVPNGRKQARSYAAPKEPFVLTAGRLWDEAKNALAVSKIARRLPWPVYFAGENRDPDGGAVDFPGCRMLGRLSQADLAHWYARASIYALPARYEPFGLSALEAALSGCALVLGDIESLREIWGDAAIFVPPNDPPQLEGALRELIALPSLLREMAKRASLRARRFTPEQMAREYFTIYGHAASSRRSALRHSHGIEQAPGVCRA
jgi:glycosyltransferase involved in cell wall biosynthesis